MHDRDCIDLLQWALPRLGHRWRGYRQVRRLVPGGCLVVGAHEHLPDGVEGISPWPGRPAFYRKPD